MAVQDSLPSVFLLLDASSFFADSLSQSVILQKLDQPMRHLFFVLLDAVAVDALNDHLPQSGRHPTKHRFAEVPRLEIDKTKRLGCGGHAKHVACREGISLMLGIGHTGCQLSEIKEVSIADGWIGRFNIRTSSHETDVGHCGDDFLHGLPEHVVTLVTLFAGEEEDEWTLAKAMTEPESLGIGPKNTRWGHSGKTKLARRNALLYQVRVFHLRAD